MNVSLVNTIIIEISAYHATHSLHGIKKFIRKQVAIVSYEISVWLEMGVLFLKS